MPWFHRLTDRLAERPAVFHWLRRLPEANFTATKARIRAVQDTLGAPRVLDAGCGTGEFSPLFDPARYLGVDLNTAYLAYAARRHPEYRYQQADLTRWGGSGESFELGLVNGVLHHLDDSAARAVLDTVVRQLAPGGTLLVIEDVTLPDAGLATQLIHALDHGEHIRDTARWRSLVSAVLPITRDETYQSGACPYHLMLCRVP
jgi:trans-aconitate methyltransferase